MIRKIFITILICLFFPKASLAMDFEESNVYANFILEIMGSTKLEKKGKICVMGNDEVARILLGRDDNLLKFDYYSDKGYNKCNIMYISQGMERALRIELEKLTKMKILTIAVFDNFVATGGMIQVQLGRRNFELTVNYQLLKASGVKLDALATNLIIN